MAQSPTVAVPARLPLIAGPENRDNSTAKDSRIINCYVETSPDRSTHIYRRPGMLTWGIPPLTSAAGRGVYYWNGYVYSIFGTTLYKGLASVATGLDGTGGVYSFNSILGTTPHLVLQNGVQGYAYEDTGGLSANLHSINASYPAYTTKGLAYLNGAIYVMQHFFGTAITPAVIWGSVPNSVSVSGDWDPLDYITAQIEPDSGVYLSKQSVYVVALKGWTTEFFSDVGNPTGSPLLFYPAGKLNYGCASADSVQSIQEILFFISTNRDASNQILMLEQTQPRVVSTPDIDRLLNQIDLSVVYSWHIKVNGHNFYVVTIKNANLTLAYDLVQNRWEQWTDTNGNYMPIVASCRDSAGNHILQHESNGTLYYASPNYLTDDGSVMPITVITPLWDAGTSRRKQLGRMIFDTDQVTGAIMQVQVTDDDYQTWSQPRKVDMSLPFPKLDHCGTFTRRAFKFTINNNLPFRLKSVELQFDVGTL